MAKQRKKTKKTSGWGGVGDCGGSFPAVKQHLAGKKMASKTRKKKNQRTHVEGELL